MEEGEEVVVVYEYMAALPDELSLKVGDVITRVERLEGGWWRGELNKVRGMFPDNFVKVRQRIFQIGKQARVRVHISKSKPSPKSNSDCESPVFDYKLWIF